MLVSETLDWNFSDHLAVAAKRKMSTFKHPKVQFTGRSYRNYVKEDFQASLIQDNWEGFYNSANPEVCWDIIDDAIKRHIDAMCPQKLFKVREVREPCITNEILEEIKVKDHAMRAAKRPGNVNDWQHAKTESNRVGSLVDQAKADFLKEQQTELAGDPKKFWRVVKSIVPGKKSKTSKISLNRTGVDGTEVSVEDSSTADYINKFFSGIGPKLAAKHKKTWRFHGDKVNVQCPPFSTDFMQVLKLCRDINTTKSSGFSDVSSKVYRDAFMVLIPQITHLFNMSFATGIFPSKWKQATIIPLYKGVN